MIDLITCGYIQHFKLSKTYTCMNVPLKQCKMYTEEYFWELVTVAHFYILKPCIQLYLIDTFMHFIEFSIYNLHTKSLSP